MSKVDWSKAPEWATCVIKNDNTSTLFYSEGIFNGAQTMRICDDKAFIFNDNGFHKWTVFEERPVPRPTLAVSINDDRLNNDLRSVPLPPPLDKNCRCTFTPAKQPSTAPDLLKQAAQLLSERGQQYDKSGNERSAAKIVAAFNAVTGRDLTPGEGWLFLVMLKAVRFYSNTETPHRDSLEDMIAYAALHAEEYLNDK